MSNRLFRTANNDPLTINECYQLCYNTAGCHYFTIGISSHGGVCIGCTKEATLSTHAGFEAYEMTSMQTFPTAAPTTVAPTTDSEYFNAAGTNKKCPHRNNARLFRTPNNKPLSRQECYERCYNTEGCEYFSLAEDTDHDALMGVCMGCTAESVLSYHVGFNAFIMEIKPPAPSAAPITQNTPDLYELVELNKKCPWNNRLFRTADHNPLTRNECYERCKNEPTCEYFTFGEGASLKNAWKGMCMGCTGGATLSRHAGFNTYDILP